MSGQHTPGRLRVFGREIYAADGTRIAEDISEANARRLVACWNACEGIDTEYLEGDESLPHYTRRLMNQRDGLLAALGQIERLGREADGNLVDVRAMLGDIASAAIAKVKGGAA